MNLIRTVMIFFMCWIYRIGFGLVNILAYGTISDDFCFNFYLANGSLYPCDMKRLSFVSPDSHARYLRESMGLTTNDNRKTAMQASVMALNIFSLTFIINVFFVIFSKLYLVYPCWSLFASICFELVYFAVYFCIIHGAITHYWRSESASGHIRICFYLNVLILLALPKVVMSFPNPIGFSFFISIFLLSVILSLPIFPLHLIITARIKRMRHRGIV